MNYPPNRGFPAGNPLANALVVVVGALVIGASVVLGFLAFVVLAALLAVFAAVIGIRVWWLKRKLARAARQHPSGTSNRDTARVIEGEFHVISTRSKEPPEA